MSELANGDGEISSTVVAENASSKTKRTPANVLRAFRGRFRWADKWAYPTDGEYRKVRVGPLDKLISHSAHWLVFGPIEPLDQQTIVAGLAELSGGDPKNRIGLIPRGDTQVWNFDPEYAERAIVSPPRAIVANNLDSVESILGAVQDLRVDRPMAISQIGRDLLIYFDHGLGDPYLLLDVLMAASYRDFDQRPFPRMMTPNTRWPVLIALGTSFRTSPWQTVSHFIDIMTSSVRKLARSVRERNHQSNNRQLTCGDDGMPAECREQTIYAVSSPEYATHVRKYRERHGLTASTSALTLLWLCRALEAEGIAVSPEVSILVDLRRHLPHGLQTYANFIGVPTVKYGSACTEEEFGRQYAEQSQSTRPLVNLAFYLVAARFAPALRRWTGSSGRDLASPGQAIITYTDPSKLPWDRCVAWADGPRHIAGIARPATPSHIAIMVLSAGGGEIHVTATFHPSRFDTALVRDALTKALDTPMAEEV